MKQIFILLIAVSLCKNGFGQLGNYNENGAVDILSQKVTLTITPQPKPVATEKQAAGAIAGAILGPAVDVGLSIIKEKVKQNAAKFTSTYSAKASGSAFWEDANTANLPGLTLTRDVLMKSSAAQQNALTITLTPELSPDNTAFRFVVSSPIAFNYSAAKTKRSYDYIDIKLDIVFKTLSVTKSQYEVKDLRATSITIPMVKAGTASAAVSNGLASGWIPLLTKPTMEIVTDLANKEVKEVAQEGTKDGKKINETLTTTTTTTNAKATDKTTLTKKAGLYEIEITVTETNPYKIKADNIQSLVESSSDATSKLLNALIDAIFKKDDKSKDDKSADK